MSKPCTQRGFTIVELMIATLVFSTVLLLCTTGLIAVARMYQKGNTSRATQEVARSAIDQIKNDFELSGGNYIAIDVDQTGTDHFCIGDNLYTYELKTRKIAPNGTGHAFVVSQPVGGCNASTPAFDLNDTAAPGRELLGPNMRLAQFVITPSTPSNPASISIFINVVSGDEDLLTAERNGCLGGPGQEYCAGSVLETYATKRL